MNDSMEIHWGYQIWEKAASELLNEVGRAFLDEIDKIIHSSGLHVLPTASCYSRDGDVLSQWRAYAGNGLGYALGFSARDVVRNMPVHPLRVLYSEKDQILEAKRTILAIHKFEETEEVKYGDGFFEFCRLFACDMAAFKNPAFHEEKEVRLLHLLNFERSNNFLRLVDPGGHTIKGDVEGVPVQFRVRESMPAAFVELDFAYGSSVNPIKEVVIGPRNDVMTSAISIFLETVGLGSVNVKRSKASYR